MAVLLGGASTSPLVVRRDQYYYYYPAAARYTTDGGSCSSIWFPDGREGMGRIRRGMMPPSISKGSSSSSRELAVKKAAAAFWQQDLWSPPHPAVMTIEMEPISDNDQLDHILSRCQQQEPPQSIVIDWMAAWCRKCIYLKPKLEKLATEFHPKVKFYTVDVNEVPKALIMRGKISKMPTIQLWKDGEMKAEIIGGHKAWLVVEEVREMIRKNI